MSFCFNYNSCTTIKNSDVIKNKIIEKYNNRKKYIPDKIKSVYFANKVSVQDDKLLFTNKFQRSSSKRILAIRNMVNELVKNPDSIKYYFDGRDLECRTEYDIYKLERLDAILKLNDTIPSNVLVSKYAPNQNYYRDFNFGDYERGFQLILNYKNGNITVYLIDLYHLAIQSKKNNFKNEYAILKNYKKCLSETIFSTGVVAEIKNKELEAVGS